MLLHVDSPGGFVFEGSRLSIVHCDVDQKYHFIQALLSEYQNGPLQLHKFSDMVHHTILCWL